jgi:hypothetical protein
MDHDPDAVLFAEDCFRIEILFDAGALQPGIIGSLQELRTDR